MREMRETRDELRETRDKVVASQATPRQATRRGRMFMRVYIAALVAVAAAFILLAVVISEQVTPEFDVPLARAIQSVHQPVYAWVLTQASQLGWFPANVISYLLIFGVLFALRLRLEAVLGVGSSLLADAAGVGIKHLVGRLRPTSGPIQVFAHLGGYSFPSGHVLEYVTLFGFAAYVALVVWRGGWLRVVVVVVMILLIVLVGPSRVYLGEHYPSDVLGAYLLGALWLAGTIQLHLFLRRRLGPWWVPAKERAPTTGRRSATRRNRRR